MRLYRLGMDSYRLSNGNETVCGNLRLISVLMHRVGVQWDEIEAGILALELDGNDVADYGVALTFIYAYRVKSDAA